MGEFHRLLETVPEKLAIFSGRTDQRRMQDPLSLVQNTLANQLELTVSDRNTTVPEKVFAGLESVVGDRAVQSQVGRELTQVIARLVGFDLPGSLSTSAGIPDADERVRVFDLLLAYFQAIAGRSAGTIIFLEDIHWADDDSLDFFEQIGALAALMPFMVIATTRPQLFERRARWPGDLGGSVEQLTLSPLSDSDSRALVLHLLQKLPSKTPAMVDVIVRSAGGNPFYIEELIKVLIEDGILLPGDPIWRMRPLDLWRMRVPATLTTVLQTRLDRLPESERVTLQQAAVLGDEFWDKAVRQINQASRWSLSDEQLDAALQSLEERGLIARVPSRLSTGSQAFRFRHAMLREVTYENVLLRDRPGYHLQAARWLEAQSGDRLAEHVTLIAQHYESAGQFSTAVRMYQLAAARAADLSQTDNAISHYRHALVLLNHLPHELDVRVDIMSRLGMLLRRDGRFVEALKIFYDMSRTAELDGNLLRQAQAENAQATIYAEMGETGQAMTAAITAERVARLTDAELEFIQALRLQAGFLIDMERFDDALVTISEATDRSRLLDAPRELAGSLVLLNALYRRTGETDKATRVIAELSALAGTLETKGAMAEAGFVLGRLAELVANDELYSDACSILARALDLQRPAADRSEVAESLRQLGLAVGRGGDPAQAVAYLDEATTMAETDGNRYLRLVCRLAMGEMLLAWGRYEAAEATLRQVIAAAEDPERIGHWRRTRDARRLLAEALARQGRRDEAKWVTDNARLSEHGR
jgi:predicted ATPase